MPDTNEHAVIASFDSVAQAEQAVERLKAWDEANDDGEVAATTAQLTAVGGTALSQPATAGAHQEAARPAPPATMGSAGAAVAAPANDS